jgi:2-methylisocitrate lyase-like PEP mutase family enzyme
MLRIQNQAILEELQHTDVIQFIGVYDVFSASLAAQHFDGIFISGFGFAASHYGLPDIGFISWSDIVDFVRRVRAILPQHHILVDIDDGYADVEVACHVVSLLESARASAVILEDQKRPRRCGHVDGKQIMDLDEYLIKLGQVLDTRREMMVVARTDATDPKDIRRRALAFAEAGADAILVDGLKDLKLIRQLADEVDKPFMFNQIAGGKSAPCTIEQLRDAGVSLVNYSTPCLFAAQAVIEDTMRSLKENDGRIEVGPSQVSVPDCNTVLYENLKRRSAQ